MLLRSLNFTKRLTEDMINILFEDYKDFRGEFDYSVELIEAALSGRINFNKPFNLFGYCKVIRDGKYQNNLKRLKRQEYIIDDDDDEKTGVKISSLVEERDDYDILIDTEELMFTVKKIIALNDEIIVNTGVDLIFCMRKAVSGYPEAVSELTDLCKEYSWIAEYVQIILSSGISFEDLFPENVSVFIKPIKNNEFKKQVV